MFAESKMCVFDSSTCLRVFGFQEKRRAERAEQQRIRAERDKERQARREVGPPQGTRSSTPLEIH